MKTEARSQKSVVSRQSLVVGRRLPTVRCPLLLFTFCLLLSACMPSGIANVSTNGQKFAVVNSNDLYVYSVDSAEAAYYTFFPDLRYSPALAPDGSAVAYVDRGGRLQYQALSGGQSRQLLPNPINQPGPGLLTFLPDGRLMVINSGNFDRDLRIFDVQTGQTVQWLTGLSQIFYSAGAIAPRESSSALNRFAVGRVDAGGLDHVNLVILPTTCLTEDRRCFFSYTIDSTGFKDNGPLPRAYDTDLQIFLTRRVENDLTSGLLTPDGRHLVLRMRSFAGADAQSLYLLDLTANTPPIALVENAPGRPDYAISPDGQFIAYDEVINNVAFVRLYNLLTGERTDLGPGTLDPQWWQ